MWWGTQKIKIQGQQKGVITRSKYKRLQMDMKGKFAILLDFKLTEEPN